MDLERVAKLEAQMEDLKDDVKEVKDDIKEIHSRITTGNREIMDKIDDLDQRIEERMTKSTAVAKKHHDEVLAEIQKDIKEVADRVAVLEKWKWMVIGGAIVIGYSVGNLDLMAKFIK